MGFIKRAVSWSFTGLTLAVFVIWMYGWALWHTRAKRQALAASPPRQP